MGAISAGRRRRGGLVPGRFFAKIFAPVRPFGERAALRGGARARKKSRGFSLVFLKGKEKNFERAALCGGARTRKKSRGFSLIFLKGKEKNFERATRCGGARARKKSRGFSLQAPAHLGQPNAPYKQEQTP